MEKNKPIELRSEKVRNIIGRMPPMLVRYGTVMIIAALLVLAGIATFVPYQPKISIEIVAAQSEGREVHYTARIPQSAMTQLNDIVFIEGSPQVERAIPVHFIFHDVPDTLYISNSGGWYEVEVYPVKPDDQAIKIPTPFTFPAKIKFKYTTILEWVMGKGRMDTSRLPHIM